MRAPKELCPPVDEKLWILAWARCRLHRLNSGLHAGSYGWCYCEGDVPCYNHLAAVTQEVRP